MTWRSDPQVRRDYARNYYRENYAAKALWTGERRTTPGASCRPTVADLHWAAGFLEGEGCFYRFRRPGAVSIGVGATQVDTEPLEKLQRLFGGRITKKSMTARNRQQPHAWTVYGARAWGVALTLYTLLSNRRKAQCLACLAALAALNVELAGPRSGTPQEDR
jgi:hypothetical protein